MDIALMRILQQHEKAMAEATDANRRNLSQSTSPGTIQTPYDWIASALQKADLNGIGGMDVIEALLRMPCWDKRLADMVKAHVARQRSLQAESVMYDVSADRSLGPAELFVLSVPLGVPQAQQKLLCMQFVGSVNESLHHLHAPVSRLLRACKEVLESPRLVVLLRDVMLPAGNALNTHSSKAAASGIKLSSLPALSRTRSKSNVSLLRYIATKIVRLADSDAVNEPERADAEETGFIASAHGLADDLTLTPTAKSILPRRAMLGSASAAGGILQLPAISEGSASDAGAPEAPPKTPKPGTPLDSPARESGPGAVGLRRTPTMQRTSSLHARRSFASVSIQDLLDPAADIPTAMTVGRVSLDQVISDSISLHAQASLHLSFVEKLMRIAAKKAAESQNAAALADAAAGGEMPGIAQIDDMIELRAHRRRVTVDRREPAGATSFADVISPQLHLAEDRISELLAVCLDALLGYVDLCKYTCEEPALPQQADELKDLSMRVALKVAARKGTVMHPRHPAIGAALPEQSPDDDECVTCSELLDALQWFVQEWGKEVAYGK